MNRSAEPAAPIAFLERQPRPRPAHDRDPAEAKDGFDLNFENTPVATVAKVVLGDIMGVGYVIDPRAQGTISLSSGRAVAKKDLLFVLEARCTPTI